MSSRNLFASVVMACLLTAGLNSVAPVANAAPAGQQFLKPVESAGNNLIEIRQRRRSRGPRFNLPIGPGRAYQEYPYYYSRGYYPTHIRGYTYNHAYPYYHRRSYHAGYRERCAYTSRRCATNRGYRTSCIKYRAC